MVACTVLLRGVKVFDDVIYEYLFAQDDSGQITVYLGIPKNSLLSGIHFTDLPVSKTLVFADYGLEETPLNPNRYWIGWTYPIGMFDLTEALLDVKMVAEEVYKLERFADLILQFRCQGGYHGTQD